MYLRGVCTVPGGLAAKCSQIWLRFNLLAVCFGNIFVAIIKPGERSVDMPWITVQISIKLVWLWIDAISHSEKRESRERSLFCSGLL